MGIDSWTERIEILMSSLTHILYIHTTKHVYKYTKYTNYHSKLPLFFEKWKLIQQGHIKLIESHDYFKWMLSLSTFYLSKNPKKIYYVFQHKY